MAVPLLTLAVKSFEIYNKAKLIKAAIDLTFKKDKNKVDVLLNLIPGKATTLIKEYRKYNEFKKIHQSRIAINKAALLRERQRDYWIGHAYNEKRFLENIMKHQNAIDNYIKDKLKKAAFNKLKSLTPLRGTIITTKHLIQAITNKEGWDKIATETGRMLSKGGFSGLKKVMSELHRAKRITLTANQFWKRISENHSASAPLIGTKGATAILRHITIYKKGSEIIDRAFSFFVSSPQTGNFSQFPQTYNPLTKNLAIPMRGWYGKRNKIYIFKNVDLNTTLSTIIFKFSFGHFYNAHYITDEGRYWANIYGQSLNSLRDKETYKQQAKLMKEIKKARKQPKKKNILQRLYS